MNGTLLGQPLAASTAVDRCAAALEMLNVSLIYYARGNFSIALSSSDSRSTDAFIEGLGLVDEGEVEQMCSLYVSGFVPRLRSQLLPSLATLRSTASNGYCAVLESECVSLFDYTLTGQYTKMTQLLGDVLCATQTPAFNRTSSQRCGYTFLQSSGEVANTTSADRAAALLKDLQAPTHQACLKAKVKCTPTQTATQLKQFRVTSTQAVVVLDRFATWINALSLVLSPTTSTCSLILALISA